MCHYMYRSKVRCNNSTYSCVLRLVEDNGRVSCVRFGYAWDTSEWKDKYAAVKNEYDQVTRGYQNWELTKAEYMRDLKQVWLEHVSGFVEETSDRDRDLIPLGLRKMIHDTRTLLGYPKYALPVILHVKDHGYGSLVFLVEWDVFGCS